MAMIMQRALEVVASRYLPMEEVGYMLETGGSLHTDRMRAVRIDRLHLLQTDYLLHVVRCRAHRAALLQRQADLRAHTPIFAALIRNMLTMHRRAGWTSVGTNLAFIFEISALEFFDMGVVCRLLSTGRGVHTDRLRLERTRHLINAYEQYMTEMDQLPGVIVNITGTIRTTRLAAFDVGDLILDLA